MLSFFIVCIAISNSLYVYHCPSHMADASVGDTYVHLNFVLVYFLEVLFHYLDHIDLLFKSYILNSMSVLQATHCFPFTLY